LQNIIHESFSTRIKKDWITNYSQQESRRLWSSGSDTKQRKTPFFMAIHNAYEDIKEIAEKDKRFK
jgi:hypothetical protein